MQVSKKLLHQALLLWKLVSKCFAKLWNWKQFDRTLSLIGATIGVLLGVWSLYLTFQLDSLHQTSQKNALRSAFSQVVSLNPWGGTGALEKYTDDQMDNFLRNIYTAINSQADNEYIELHKNCANAWKGLNDFLWMSLKDKSFSNSLYGQNASKNFSIEYYQRYGAIKTECMGYK